MLTGQEQAHQGMPIAMIPTAYRLARPVRPPTMFRADAAPLTVEPSISLNDLWRVGGSKPGGEPRAWLIRGGESVADGALIRDGQVIANPGVARQYLLDTNQEALAPAIDEAGRIAAADLTL